MFESRMSIYEPNLTWDTGQRQQTKTSATFYDPIPQPRECFLIVPFHPWPLVGGLVDHLKPLIRVDTVRTTEPSTDAQPVSLTGKKK